VGAWERIQQDTTLVASHHYKEDSEVKSNKAVAQGEASELADEHDLGLCAEKDGFQSSLPH